MRIRFLLAFVISCLLLIGGAAVVGADAWIQFDGGPQTTLQLTNNPDYVPGSQEGRYVWYGEFNLAADYPQVLHGIGGGGSFVDQFGDPIMVRIKQTIVNTGQEPWIDFHIRVSGGGFPYKVWNDLPPGWSVSQSLDSYDYWADPGPPIMPGGSFVDGVVIYVVPDQNGDGSFELTKWPTVPEPGTLAAIAGGLSAVGAGFRVSKRRRKA